MDTATPPLHLVRNRTEPPALVTDCRIMLPRANEDPRVLCYCSVVLFGMVKVNDCKLIDCGGRPHLAMPQREHRSACPWCGFKRVRARDRHCSGCGARLSVARPFRESAAAAMRDVVHPTDPGARAALESAVVVAYRAALAAAANVDPNGGQS